MAISHDFQSFPSPVIFTIIAAAVAIIVFRFVFSSSSSPNAPKRVGWGYPFVGTYEFFNARWDLFRQSSLLTASGNFTFFIGPHQVVGLSGDKGRETFFESRDLSFSEGYVGAYLLSHMG
jgi:sterol 14-demethylase